MNTERDERLRLDSISHGFYWVLWVLLLGSVLFLALAFLSGCAVTKPLPQPTAVVPLERGQAAAPPVSPPVVESPAPQVAVAPVPSAPPVEPVIEEQVQRPVAPKEKPKRKKDVVTRSGVKYELDPERKYTLRCCAWCVVTIKFPAGEVIRLPSMGNQLEWIIDPAQTGLGLSSPVITIRRTPQAPRTEMHVIADSGIYQFILVPTQGEVTEKGIALIEFHDPAAEQQRLNDRVLHAAAQEQRRRSAYENRMPTLNAEHLRNYEIGGDNVRWRPIKIEGDHKHTFIFLPAATGAEQPTLAVVRDGVQTRINSRTVPGRDGNGPILVADQPFSEAVLTGEDGVVSITGRGN